MIRLLHAVVLLSLTVVGLTACAGPKVAASKNKPSAAGTPSATAGATPKDDAKASRDAYWNLAMQRYSPPATGVQPAAIELAEPGTAVTPTISTTQSVALPMAAVPTQALDPADVPFATWAPGKRGVVKSPYDPTGRLIDVRDFSAGQLSQCPYTGKIFRVPPLK